MRTKRLHTVAIVLVAVVAATPLQAGDEACPQDFDGNGEVDFADLLSLLAAWGPCPGCPQDLSDDGAVGFEDLLSVLAAWGPCPGDSVLAIELAGNPLALFPHFEFVRAFNAGAGVSIAIDPRHLAGRRAPCDVYVVAAKTQAEWTSDAGLEDVRGGPQTNTFDGATIQENTVALTESTALSADAGIDVGVGYDLVCDCNQNAMLDAGDIIDGLSDEAGLYVIHDLTTLGPLSTTSATFSIELLTGAFSQQRIYYPTDLADLGPRPLIVIGHGGGHQFTWYDYLQEHLASHGYIVTSHPNSFGGAGTLQQEVIKHTDALIERQGEVLDGALDGLIDTERIAWIGHSLGGRAVLLAYDKIFDGLFTPQNFSLDDLQLLCGIASNSLEGPDDATPHDAPFHLLFGSADGDISGSPLCGQCQPFRHVDRAEGFAHSTYVQGADHNDFNCCGFQNFTGPPVTEIGRAEAQRVAKAVYLALMKHYLEANIPSKDLLWRQWEQFKPIGVAEKTIVDSIYVEAPQTGKFVIDDYQDGVDHDESSSGGAVAFSVSNLVEDRLDDGDSTFTWLESDPMNGMTHAGPGDTSRGVVFDWSIGDEVSIDYEVVAAARDFSPFVALSLRACQGTRHPETIAELGDLLFTVTLEDGEGATSSIQIGAYGGGIEEPYQRSRAGIGTGWQNEFETIRIRLTDFLNNGSDLVLTNVTTVRLEFGASSGSARGRLGLDDLELTTD